MMKMLHATVSHDMMSPIAAIRFFADQLVNAKENGDELIVKKYHKLITDSLKLVQCRMKDLLDKNLIENNCFVPQEVEFVPI